MWALRRTGSAHRFRDWYAECADAPREVAEQALSHVNPNKTEAAYARSDLFVNRAELMERWSQYITNFGREVNAQQ